MSSGISEGTIMSESSCQPDKMFVYSDWYIQFWRRKFQFNDTKFYICQSCDLEVIDVLDTTIQDENSICYLCQTLVEDRRMDKTAYKKLILGIISSLPKNMKIYFKLHPRSNKELYQGYENIELIRNMPNCKLYITHYSSIILPIFIQNGNVIFYEIENQPTPEIFKFMAINKAQKPDELKKAVLKRINEGPLSTREERINSAEQFLSIKTEEYHEIIYNMIHDE